MTGIRARVARWVDASIWAEGAIGPRDVRVSALIRRRLPEFYCATVIWGVLGAWGGVPALRDTFGEDYATAIGLALVLAGLGAGVGEAFPAKLWRLEFYSVGVLSGVAVLYAGTVAFAGLTTGDVGRAAVAAAIWSMSVLPRWRLVDVWADARRNGWR